jgi:hypothetical protein
LLPALGGFRCRREPGWKPILLKENANWLFVSCRKIYIVDLDSMAMDDPAFDLGALLWWYYPPEFRQRFLKLAG